MNTWTFKGLVKALATCLALAGCDAVDGLALSRAFDREPLKSAELADGAITLVAPEGFCIDPRSLKARFALMARCDTLGGDKGQDAPLAVITATAVPLTANAFVTIDDLVTEHEAVLSRETLDNLTMVQVQGDPPIENARAVYWYRAYYIRFRQSPRAESACTSAFDSSHGAHPFEKNALKTAVRR
jgi:hypothetical protein